MSSPASSHPFSRRCLFCLCVCASNVDKSHVYQMSRSETVYVYSMLSYTSSTLQMANNTHNNGGSAYIQNVCMTATHCAYQMTIMLMQCPLPSQATAFNEWWDTHTHTHWCPKWPSATRSIHPSIHPMILLSYIYLFDSVSVCIWCAMQNPIAKSRIHLNGSFIGTTQTKQHTPRVCVCLYFSAAFHQSPSLGMRNTDFLASFLLFFVCLFAIWCDWR